MATSDTASRRRKSDKRQRTAQPVQVRVTDDERAAFEARASAAGFQSVADFVRVRCLGGRPMRPRLDVVQLVKVEAALHRIGVNVNQIAARVNVKDEATAAQLASVKEAQEQLYRLVEGLYPER